MRRGRGDHVGYRPVADALRQGSLVEHVPGARIRLAGRRLHEVVFRPRHLVCEELLAAVVEDTCVAAVQLRLRDEVGLGEVRVGHVPSVELVHSGRQRSATFARVHRRALVNLAHVVRLVPNEVGGFVAETTGGRSVEVSRQAARDLRRRLGVR